MDADETAFPALDALDDLPPLNPELVAWANKAAAIDAEAKRRLSGRGLLAFASCLLLAGVATAQDDKKPKVQVNGGLQAEIVSLARQGQWTITAQVRLTNTSQNTAFILIMGIPTAVDDAGMRYDRLPGGGAAVSGVAFCEGPHEVPPRARACLGLPKVEPQFLFPMQGFTEIAPDKSALANISIVACCNGPSGGKAKLAFELAYRMVKPEDVDKDPDIPEADRRKRVRISSVDFPPQEVVTSTIKFDPVK